MDDGRWTMDDGRWTMDDGRWTMDDGEVFALDFRVLGQDEADGHGKAKDPLTDADFGEEVHSLAVVSVLSCSAFADGGAPTFGQQPPKARWDERGISPPDEWRQCSADRDCETVETTCDACCDDYSAVNKMFATAFGKKMADRANKADAGGGRAGHELGRTPCAETPAVRSWDRRFGGRTEVWPFSGAGA
jgi:hypothetical protein